MKEPKIRFNEFKGEWEVHSLSEKEFPIIAGGDIDKTILKNSGKYPVVANALTNDGILGYYENSYRVQEPAVTVTGRGEVGIAVARHYSFTPVVRLLSIKSMHNVDFLANAINCYKVPIESTGVPQLTTVKLQEYKIPMPRAIEEEDAIAKYITTLDAQISASTSRLASLKQIKAASLQAMFPQEGETVPKLRFKGFEGEWEKVKLGDVGIFKSNGVDKTIHNNEKIVNLLNYLDVYNARLVTKNNCHQLMHVSASDRQIKECDIQMNDIFFTPSSETAEDIGHVLVIKETLPNTCYSYHLLRYRPNKGIFYNDFPNYGFATEFVRSQMRLLAKGVQRYVIGKSEFESVVVQIPSFAEQRAIASFFTNLDRQITLQSQRLEKLKQIKAACLDKMFV